jgi:flagellar biosynthesis/type III secretory pathway protein FliH
VGGRDRGGGPRAGGAVRDPRAPELLAQTPAGQDIIEQSRPDIESRARAEGMEKGIEKGMEKGREEATMAHIRRAALSAKPPQ